MKKILLMLVSCVMVFTVVITVSASNSKGPGAKQVFSVDLASQPEARNPQTDPVTPDKIDGPDGTTGKDTTGNENSEGTDETAGTGVGDDIADPEEAGWMEAPYGGSGKETDVLQETEVPAETTVVKPIVTMEQKFDLSLPEMVGTLFLVNRSNLLDSKFVPKGLVSVSSQTTGGTIPVNKSNRLRSDAFAALNRMYKAAAGTGINDMVLSSGYRSYGDQKGLYTQKVNTLVRKLGRKAAEEAAAAVVAPPGSSEHQTGLAADITARALLGKSDPLVEEFAQTACGKWMGEHSWEYGFIVRYQPNKRHITGIIYEPWHFRYVGRLHAEVMFKNKFCLEEYIKYLKSSQELDFSNVEGASYRVAYVIPPAGTGILKVTADQGSVVEVSKADAAGYVITVRKPVAEVHK